MIDRVVARRYASAETIVALLIAGHAEATTMGARTFNVMTREWTDWYIVADDDPRLNTVEFMPEEAPAS